MDDMISRQAAIDAICEDGTRLERQGQYSMTMAERKQRDVDILEALPSAQPERRWIPCSVRLPDLDEDGYSDKVLVSFSNFTGCEICEYRIVDGKGDWYVGDSEERPAEDGIHVNAWMPLPEPYREVNK